MEVSIVILNYNTFDTTCHCIESVIRCTKAVDYEIVLVDNASTEKNADLFKEKFPGIHLVKSPVNLGFSKGNNLGIQESKGKYILLLNSDTLLFNDVISESVRTMELNKELGVLTVKLLNEDNTIQPNCGKFPSIKVGLFEFFRLQKIFRSIGERYLLGTFFKYNKDVYPDWVWGTYFLFPAALLNQLPQKKLSDVFFMYCEDLLWCYEIKELGYKIYFKSDGAIYHLHLGNNTDRKNNAIRDNFNAFIKMKYSKIHRLALKLMTKLLCMKLN